MHGTHLDPSHILQASYGKDHRLKNEQIILTALIIISSITLVCSTLNLNQLPQFWGNYVTLSGGGVILLVALGILIHRRAKQTSTPLNSENVKTESISQNQLTLPPEMWGEVFKFLISPPTLTSINTLREMKKVCKQWNEIINSHPELQKHIHLVTGSRNRVAYPIVINTLSHVFHQSIYQEIYLSHYLQDEKNYSQMMGKEGAPENIEGLYKYMQVIEHAIFATQTPDGRWFIALRIHGKPTFSKKNSDRDIRELICLIWQYDQNSLLQSNWLLGFFFLDGSNKNSGFCTVQELLEMNGKLDVTLLADWMEIHPDFQAQFKLWQPGG